MKRKEKIVVNIDDIKTLLNNAQDIYSHLVLFLDELTNKVIHIYIKNTENVADEIVEYLEDKNIKVLEVYNLYMNFDKQLNEKISFNL